MEIPNLSFSPEGVGEAWDNIYIRSNRERNGEVEHVSNKEAQFWSLYTFHESRESWWIADLPTRELAENLEKLINQLIGTRIMTLLYQDSIRDLKLTEHTFYPEIEL